MFTLNPRDGRPIYEQIKENFQRLILSGAMQPGDKMPSVRQMANQLAINPNTLQRAYAELEGEGYLISQPGRGSFVAGSAELAAARQTKAKAQFREATKALLDAGLEPGVIRSLLDEALRDKTTTGEETT